MGDQSVHQELLQQLSEQQESLKEISDMIALEPSEQLQQLYEELLAGLQETQLALAEFVPTQVSTSLAGDENPALQQLCRFLAPNGRWYLGRAVIQDASYATMQFEYPSEPYMLQPLQISMSAVQPYHDQKPEQALSVLPAGTTVFARLRPDGLYERAELQSADPATSIATVTIFSSGLTQQIPFDHVTQSVVLQDEDPQAPAQSSGSSGSNVSMEADDLAEFESEEEEDNGIIMHNPTALAVLDADMAASRAAAAGPQTDTAHFAEWEGATRGIGSKLLAGMGYVKGSGLGQNQRGMANPLAVVSFRAGAGLGSVPAVDAPAGERKRKRGGARNRQKKHAKKSREAREQHRDSQNQHEIETGDVGLFSLINSRLGDRPSQSRKPAAAHADIQPPSLHTSKRQSKFAESSRAPAAPKPPDRKALIAHQDHTEALKQRVVKLEAMAARNSNDKVVSAQVARQLEKARAEISHAEATSSGHASALSDKEKQKKWMKF